MGLAIGNEWDRICFCERSGIGPHWHKPDAGCPVKPNRTTRSARSCWCGSETAATTDQLHAARARIDDELQRRTAAPEQDGAAPEQLCGEVYTTISGRTLRCGLPTHDPDGYHRDVTNTEWRAMGPGGVAFVPGRELVRRDAS